MATALVESCWPHPDEIVDTAKQTQAHARTAAPAATQERTSVETALLHTTFFGSVLSLSCFMTLLNILSVSNTSCTAVGTSEVAPAQACCGAVAVLMQNGHGYQQLLCSMGWPAWRRGRRAALGGATPGFGVGIGRQCNRL